MGGVFLKERYLSRGMKFCLSLERKLKVGIFCNGGKNKDLGWGEFFRRRDICRVE